MYENAEKLNAIEDSDDCIQWKASDGLNDSRLQIHICNIILFQVLAGQNQQQHQISCNAWVHFKWIETHQNDGHISSKLKLQFYEYYVYVVVSIVFSSFGQKWIQTAAIFHSEKKNKKTNIEHHCQMDVCMHRDK